MRRSLLRRKFEETFIPEALFIGVLIVLAGLSTVININPIYMASPGLPPMISTQVSSRTSLKEVRILSNSTEWNVAVRNVTVQQATFYDHCGNYMVNFIVNTTVSTRSIINITLKLTVTLISPTGEVLEEATSTFSDAGVPVSGGMPLTIQGNNVIASAVFSFMGYEPDIGGTSALVEKAR